MPNLPFRPPPGIAPEPLPRLEVRRQRAQRGLAAISAHLRRAPWFVLSAFIHAISLLIMALLIGKRSPPPEEAAGHVFEVGIYTEKPKPVEEPKPEPPPAPKPPPAPPQEPPPPRDEPQPSPPEPAPPALPVEAPPAPTPPEAVAVKAPPIIAVPGGPNPSRDPFAARSPSARPQAVELGGGSPASERAVDAGLAWLSRRQQPEGHWNDGDPQFKLAPGLSGLALLAFLGKGHTHADHGPYRDTTGRALRYLLSIQAPDGRFGEPYLVGGEPNNRYLMYHQGIATMALAETYGMTRDPDLREPIRRAVAFIERAQQDAGGWDYSDLRTGRNDTSVTGWQLMALKAAHDAGIEVSWQTLFGIMRHLDLNTSPSSGEVVYANREPGPWRRGSGMAAVGLFSYLALGWPRDCPLVLLQADILLRNLPDWALMNRNDPRDIPSCLHTMYYWYYGMLALFQLGGPAWQQWNTHLRDLLIARQRADGEHKGSWDPPDRGFDAAGGRVYTTAIAVLTLEVYYRYLPFYRAGAFDALDILEKALSARGSDATRRRALGLLASFTSDRAQTLLAAALDDPDPAVRATAQRVLVEQKAEKVVPHLQRQLESLNPLARMQAVDGLARLGGKRFIPQLIKALSDPEKVVRDRASQALRRLTGESFGFQADAPPEQRQEAVALWERWLRGDIVQPPPEGIRGKLLVVDERAPDAVVLDIGSDRAVRRGQRFEVRREGRPIATLVADKVEPTLTVARVIERRPGEAIREGDIAQSLPD